MVRDPSAQGSGIALAWRDAPAQIVPIVRDRPDEAAGEFHRQLDAAVSNFQPSFMKDTKSPNFNTRLATVETNGLWNGAFAWWTARGRTDLHRPQG